LCLFVVRKSGEEIFSQQKESGLPPCKQCFIKRGGKKPPPLFWGGKKNIFGGGGLNKIKKGGKKKRVQKRGIFKIEIWGC